MTREEVVALCGQPTQVSKEVAFGTAAKGGLVYVMDTGESGEEHQFILRS